jgi:hypothetical protein
MLPLNTSINFENSSNLVRQCRTSIRILPYLRKYSFDKKQKIRLLRAITILLSGIALSDSADLLLHHIRSIPQQNVLWNACLYHCCVELCQLFCYCVYYITFLPIRQVATERCTVFWGQFCWLWQMKLLYAVAICNSLRTVLSLYDMSKHLK